MLVIALPMVVSLGCDTAMVFIDRLFLAKLSPELMSAAMGGGLTVFMMTSFFLGLTGYTTALVAQYLGAHRKKECGVVVTQAVIFSLLAYLPILACGPLARSFFVAMGVAPGQLVPQMAYFGILLYGVILSLVRNCLAGFFSGVGRTGIVMIASGTALVVNVVLNYILIYGKLGVPALGIAGAAYGTILGGASALVVLAAAYLGAKNRQEFALDGSFRFDRGVAWKLIRFGTSPGLEMFLNLLAFDAVVLAFHAHSPATAAAATIVFNWDMVSFVPLIGVEIGVTSLVGRSMGGRDPAMAHASTISGLKVGLVYSAVIFILFAGFADALVGIFQPAATDAVFAAARPLAVWMVRLAALYVLVEAVLIVFIGALRGAGDTFWAMAMSVTTHWIMFAIAIAAFRVFAWTPEQAWAWMVALFFVFSVTVYLRYRTGAWKRITVVEAAPAGMIGDGFHETTDL